MPFCSSGASGGFALAIGQHGARPWFVSWGNDFWGNGLKNGGKLPFFPPIVPPLSIGLHHTVLDYFGQSHQ